MFEYIGCTLRDEADDFASGCICKTGYKNLDEKTAIYPGLYVLGAVSSLGKTTFIHQLADQVAAQGMPVIFFSLEQSTLELVTKSLSRTLAGAGQKVMTSLDIKKQIHDPKVTEAIREYTSCPKKITIVESAFGTTIDDIENFVTDRIQQTGEKPLVIVDYLQIIKAPVGSHMTAKELADLNMLRLKQLQRKHRIPVFVISSFNRENYGTEVSFESFKESGGIEYTADVIWGMQLQLITSESFLKETNMSRRRLAVEEAKAAIPRQVELVCLKNRFGISSFRCGFTYYPHVDFFKPNTDVSQVPTRRSR